MTQELEEFWTYVTEQKYTAKNKQDLSYLGRFTFNTLTEFEGLGRILTIIARGYLFHRKNGEILSGSAYDRVEYARNALCAWCSLPSKSDEPPFVNFGNLSKIFPELVNEKGEGWLYRHIKNIQKFAKNNPELISKTAQNKIDGISKGFANEWKKKLRQMQVPIFAVNTEATWLLRFDDILADALELGPLRAQEHILSEHRAQKLSLFKTEAVPAEVIYDVVSFCEANEQEDTLWVVLPVANFDCFYGNTNFSKKWLSKIPEDILTREVSNGVCRVKLNI